MTFGLWERRKCTQRGQCYRPLARPRRGSAQVPAQVDAPPPCAAPAPGSSVCRPASGRPARPCAAPYARLLRAPRSATGSYVRRPHSARRSPRGLALGRLRRGSRLATPA
ncbi:hypothetical protein ZWY2020_028084 [Hordeum vulgare]|nr:hypothetical protein ZWY2020_028084 [Hordeum vulgare]